MPGDESKSESNSGSTNTPRPGIDTRRNNATNAEDKVSEFLEIIRKWRDAVSAIALRGALSNNRDVIKIATALWHFLSDLIVSHTVVNPDNNPDPVICANPNCKCEQIDNEWRDVISDLNSRISALERNTPPPPWSPSYNVPWD